MEEQKLINHSSVPRRVTSWLFSANHSHAFLRGLAMSATIAAYTIVISSAIMLKDHIQRGELPWYSVDAMIVGVASAVAAAAPVVGWAGWRRRRTTMMIWMASLFIVFGFLAIPYTPSVPPTEFCNPAKPLDQSAPGVNSTATGSLVLLVVMCLVVSLTVTAMLSHAIGFMADHDLEGLFRPFGVLVMASVLGFEVFSKAFAGGVRPALMVALTAVTVVIHLLQLLKVPQAAPLAEGTAAASSEGRGVVTSIGRVVSNKAAMFLMLAMALNAAALWGFAYHEVDIVKAKFLQTYGVGFLDMHADVLRYHVVFIIILVIAAKYAAPLMPVFSRKPVLKMASTMAVLAVPIYGAAAALYCSQGPVAGLGPGGANYTQPACSLQCRCDSTQNTFAPLCVVEQMTTYLSPCHAGCANAVDANGIQYLSGCACMSGHGRAIPGGCNVAGCRDVFEYHKLLLCILILLSVVFLQLLGVAVLRTVDARDRSVAVGVMLAVAVFVVFVLGHALFFAIRVSTCAWFEAGSCQLQAPAFAHQVGGASAALTLASALITIAGYFLFDGQKQADAAVVELPM